MKLKARVTDDPCQIEQLASAWDALALQSEFVDIFATSGFARAWWRAYGAQRTLRLVVIEDASGALRLVAPLCIDHARPSILKMVGYFRADYNNVICRAGDSESIQQLFAFLRQLPGWCLMTLENVPSHAAVLNHFPHACAPDASKLTKLGSWLSVYRPLAFRQTLHLHPRIHGVRLHELRNLLEEKHYRKHVNWFGRQGTLCYSVLADPAEIRSRLDEFMDLHVREWTARNGRSLFLDQENRVFYRFLIDDLREYDAVRLHTLTLDGRLIAAHFGFEWNRRVYYYKPCYEPDFAQHSPGRLLLAHIIRDAVDGHLEEVDMLYGSESYKMQFALDVRPTGALELHRSRMQSLARRFGEGRQARSNETRAS